MLLKSKATAQDKEIMAQHKEACDAAFQLGLGNKITAEQNAKIHEMNALLSFAAQNVTVEIKARIRNCDPSEFLL